MSPQEAKQVKRARCATGRVLLAGLVLGALVSCAKDALDVKSIPVTADPSQQIDALARRVDQARQAQAPVLSPTWYARAEESLASARSERDEGGQVQVILQHVAEGNAQVDQATKYVALSQQLLPAVIQARTDARSAGGPALGESYDDAEKSFLQLTTAIEKDDVSWAERKSKGVEQEFRTVELQAIKARSETEIHGYIEKARAEGAAKLVPRTLAETERQATDLDAFITKNRYATAEVGERSAAALFQAKRLLSLTREAAKIQKANPEQDALQREANISAVAAELALPDLRDQDFASQVATVTNSVRELRKDRDYLVTQNQELRTDLASLQSQSSAQGQQLARLERDRRFNETYDEVSGYFTKNEAEVYKQGRVLVIRLRGMSFPVGQSVLQPADYELLSKVQRAIRSFGDPTVVIEGHTDTTGTASFNEQLSQQRAEAVEMYLVANNTLPKDRITAVGKGSSEPLATNNTEQGRATNRRIDVRIDASEQAAPPAVAAGAPSAAVEAAK